MPQHLIASAATLKAIRPGCMERRLSDGAGLYLLLFVNGGSHGWRLDYTFEGRRKTLSLGTYPEVSLSAARQKAEDARPLVREGLDPSAARKQTREARLRQRTVEELIAAGVPLPGSFEAVAREWFDKHSPSWAPSHSAAFSACLPHSVHWIAVDASSRASPEPRQVLLIAVSTALATLPSRPSTYSTLIAPAIRQGGDTHSGCDAD